MTPNHIYLIYMYKEDLELNSLQVLICHKIQANQPLQITHTHTHTHIYIYIYSYVSLSLSLSLSVCLSCPEDIHDILIFLFVLDTSTKKYVNEQKFILRPIYLNWLVSDISRVLIMIIIIISNYCTKTMYQNE